MEHKRTSENMQRHWLRRKKNLPVFNGKQSHLPPIGDYQSTKQPSQRMLGEKSSIDVSEAPSGQIPDKEE